MGSGILVHVFCPSVSDGTSFYRGLGPLAQMRRDFDVHPVFVSEVNWATIRMADVVFMQRPYTDKHLQIAQMAKMNRMPLWIDYDDNLFRVPEFNPTHQQYGNAQIQKNMATLVAMADEVTVSTAQLKADLEPLNRRITVIPNALNTDLLPMRAGTPGKRNPTILWRGSGTHDADMLAYSDEIAAGATKHPTWTWTFIGSPFWLTMSKMPKNTLQVPPTDPVEYMDLIQVLSPAAMIVPLLDCPFNRCKSNIGWLEAIYAGGVGIGPEWDEWKRPGCITYQDGKDFAEAVDAVVSGDIDVETHSRLGWEYIRDELTLKKTNRLRMSVLERLLSRGQ